MRDTLTGCIRLSARHRGSWFFSAVLAAVLLGASAAPAAFTIRTKQISGRTYLFLEDIATYYGMRSSVRGKATTLSSRYSSLRFTVDRRESTINGVTMHLSFAPGDWSGQALLAAVDFHRFLNPVMRTQELPRGTVRHVLIDAGHGGRDRGTKGRRYEEKVITLALAKALRTELRRKGYRVSMTREGDSSLGLHDRVAIARRIEPDLFISIHANYVGARSVRGVETFLLNPAGSPSTYGNNVRKGTAPGNRFDKQNSRVAFELQRGILRGTSCRDRGVKHAAFLVLREAPCPALLVETGFLSNPDDEKLLSDSGYQRRLARGITDGIGRYRLALEAGRQ